MFAVLTIGVPIGASPAQASGVPFHTGDVLANVGGGIIRHFSSTGTLLDTLDSTTGTTEGDGMCFDATGNLYATEGFYANMVSKFDTSGNLLVANFGSGYDSYPESCVFDMANHIYVGQPDGSTQILKFDSSGTPLGTFSPAIENRGTDWIDLAADECTMFYTSEGAEIKRFNVCTSTQLTDFNVAPLSGSRAYALRIRPNGEVLVADTSSVIRLDSAGNQIQTYTVPGTSFLFALNLDPDNTTFWTADYLTGTIFRIDIDTGTVVTQFSAGSVNVLGGITIVGEITAARSSAVQAPAIGSANSLAFMLTALALFVAGVVLLARRGLRD